MGDLIAPLVGLLVLVVGIIGIWKVFEKAGQPGWAAIVPIYNFYALLQIANKPTWWLILFFIPVANAIALILVGIGVAEKFGKSTMFGLGLAFFGFIFYPMLGFSDAQYNRGA